MEGFAPVTPYSVCAIGNSHTAMFAKAWKSDLEQQLPGVSITFFGANSQKLSHLVYEDGAFTAHEKELADGFAMTSGGLTRAEIAAYDAFLLIGLGLRITVTSLCGPYGTAQHRQWGPVDTLVSEAVFAAMVEGALKEPQPFWILEKIRSVGKQPVLLCATPFRSDKEASWSFTRKNRRFADDNFRGKVIAQCQEIGSALALRHGGEFVWQDESTISLPGFTKAEYAQGALRLGKAELEDGLHMNADFGKIALTRALTRLDELSGGRVFGGDEERALKRA
jgi:hypothetical protein